MTVTLRRTAAAAATVALMLTGAACSNDTEGDASPAEKSTTQSDESDTSASDDSETTESDASESDDASESSASDDSGSDKPAGSVEASDGSFSFNPPPGYQDALDQITVPGAIAGVIDPASDTTFPTHIVVNSEKASGSLDDVVAKVRDQIEQKFGTTTEEGTPNLDSVDGEDFRAWTTGAYKDGAQDVASAQIATEHDGKFYYFTVNTLPANRSAAGDALLAMVESVKWS